MSATPKQTRAVMRRIYLYQRRLQQALNDAHNIGVISYPKDNYNENAPCWAMVELRSRITQTTEKALADVIRTEIRASIK